MFDKKPYEDLIWKYAEPEHFTYKGTKNEE
jgi:hypothetical protein